MGMLEELNRRLDLGEKTTPEDTKELHVQAITASLMEIAENLPAATEVDLKGVEKAIQALSKAMSVEVKAPSVTVEPKIEIPAPVVNIEPATVEAHFEATLPDVGMVEYKINRDSNGYMTSVIARPYEPVEKEDGFNFS